VEFEGSVIGQSSTSHGDKNIPFRLRNADIRGDVYILNRQMAAHNTYTTYWLFVEFFVLK